MNNMNLTIDEEMFLSRLGYGIEKARTSKELGFTPRTVAQYARNLRFKGVCVCSGNEGYWLAGNEDEVLHTVRRMESRALETLKAVDAIKVAYGG